jgi:hypothetical protein
MSGNMGEYDYPSDRGQGCGTEVQKCSTEKCSVCGKGTMHRHVCEGCGKLVEECTCKKVRLLVNTGSIFYYHSLACNGTLSAN